MTTKASRARQGSSGQLGRVATTALVTLVAIVFIAAVCVAYAPARTAISEGAHAMVRLAKTGSTEPYWVQERKRLQAEYAADTTQADVVIFGDSLVANAQWQRAAPGKVVLNRGIGGDTSIDMLARIETVTAANPDVVVIFRAHTDLEHDDAQITETNIDARIAEANNRLEQIITRLQESGATVILADIPLIGAPGPFNDAIFRLNAAERRLAARLGVTTVQVSGPLSTNRRLRPEFTTDGTHLTAAGYAVVLPRVADAVEEAFAR